MLSEESLDAISKLFKHICYLKLVPFDWDSKSFTINVIEDRRIYITIATCIVLWCQCLFLFSSLVMGSLSPSERSVHLVWQSAFAFGSVASYNCLKRRYEFVTFMNHFFKLNEILKGKDKYKLNYYK